MTRLQIIGRGFGVTEELIGGFDVIRMCEHLRQTFAGTGGHRFCNGDGPVNTLDVTQFRAAEVFNRPLLR